MYKYPLCSVQIYVSSEKLLWRILLKCVLWLFSILIQWHIILQGFRDTNLGKI